jgi:hypothetical protein
MVQTVDKQIGTVTNHSDNESTQQKGTFSNKFPVGTKLFRIPNTDTNTAIAIKTKDGTYIVAIAQGKPATLGNITSNSAGLDPR